MLQDRFVKMMLVVIALLLALNLLRPGMSVMTTPATAQIVTTTQKTATLDVKAVKGYTVAGLKEIVAVGDGKSFVVSRSDGFMVYQVSDPYAPPVNVMPVMPSAPSQPRY